MGYFKRLKEKREVVEAEKTNREIVQAEMDDAKDAELQAEFDTMVAELVEAGVKEFLTSAEYVKENEQMIFDILHEQSKALEYRMLTRAKRKLAQMILKAMNEKLIQ